MSFTPSRLTWRFSNLQHEIDEAFAALIERPWGRTWPSVTGWPAVDLYESDDVYILLADLPGVAPEDVELHVKEREVMFCGLRWSASSARQGREVIVERSCGRFCRRFLLKDPVDNQRVEQGYENGVYWARLPKRTSSEASQRE